MYHQQLKSIPLLLAILGYVAAAPQRNGGNNSGNSNANTSGGSDTTLLAANIQSASDSDGQANEEAGQSPSITDPANFINFCSGKTVTNGLQVTQGSCNGIVMGDIPSTTNMISSIIVNPGPGDNIAANTEFSIQVQVSNLVAGTFTNPNTTYYAAPQQLQGGKVIGHTHVTVQDLGNSLAPNTPPAPGTFAFFKGINDDGNGNGLLAATVAGGLPAGNYRVCTMTSSSNHQPVLMPIAQRGAQDDCTKFTVGGNAGSGTSGSGSSGSNNAAAASSSASASSTANTGGRNRGSGNNAGASTSAVDVATTSTTTPSTATTTSASSGRNRNGSGSGSGSNGSNGNSFTTTTTATAITTTAATAQNAETTSSTSDTSGASTTSTDGSGFGRGRNHGSWKHRYYGRDLVVV